MSGEYLQNQCIGPGGEPALNCEPCVDRLPSCIGLQDGNNTFPGRQNTPYYITCYLNRTILVRTCEDGVYDQTSRACMTKLDPGKTLEQVCFITNRYWYKFQFQEKLNITSILSWILMTVLYM